MSDWRYSRITDTESAEPYMDRWIVTFVTGHQLRLHHILRSDQGRDFHDHPFTCLTLILWGGYWEIRPRQWLQKVTGGRYPSTAVHYQWYGPGSCRKLLVDGVPHRVELQGGRTAWTLVWAWPKTKMWGFWLGKGEDARWIPHYNYDYRGDS